MPRSTNDDPRSFCKSSCAILLGFHEHLQIFLDIELQVSFKACSYLSSIDSLNDSFIVSLNTFVGLLKSP